MGDIQNNSWFDPRGSIEGESMYFQRWGWLVAQIYFRTNESRLDNDDQKVLDMLFKAYGQSPEMLDSKIKTFWFIGCHRRS